jgi:CMP/dCMP kinase
MKKTIFTIGRQYGSGGRIIGKKLAEKLDIPFYDRELLTEVAKDNPYSEQILESFDEKPMKSLLYSIAMGTGGAIGNPAMPLSVQAYLAQFQTIKKLADECERGCVFIGRCSDYVLQDRDDVVSVFIKADLEYRKEHAKSYSDDISGSITDKIRKIDKNRASYYEYYTENKWGNASNYDLCLDSGKIGEENCVKLICEFAEMMR